MYEIFKTDDKTKNNWMALLYAILAPKNIGASKSLSKIADMQPENYVYNWTDVKIKELKKLYWKDKLSVREISNIMKIDVFHIKYKIKILSEIGGNSK